MISFFRRIRSLSPLEGYNLWSRSYHAEANPIKEESDRFIKNNVGDLTGKSFLDAGCGTGKFCTLAIDRNAAFVKGIDLSPSMINEAKKNCPEAEFQCADLSTVFLDQFDVVVCGLVLGHIDHLQPVLTKLIKALNPGGHLILTDFHPYQTINKAKRTFKINGKIFEIRHTLHPLEEYFSTLKNWKFEIAEFAEPKFHEHPVIFGIHGIAP